jgi:hypothetical protein
MKIVVNRVVILSPAAAIAAIVLGAQLAAAAWLLADGAFVATLIALIFALLTALYVMLDAIRLRDPRNLHLSPGNLTYVDLEDYP